MRAATRWPSSAHPCSNARVDRSPELSRDNLGFLLAKASQRWNELLAEGFANKELGRRLFVSEKTVKTHVSSILQKLGVQDRTQAALTAVRLRLLD